MKYSIETTPSHMKKMKEMLNAQVKVLVDNNAAAATIKAAKATRDEIISSIKAIKENA